PFFTNLVLYLTGFSGQRSVVLDAHADHPGPLDAAFEQLLSALDPSGAVRSEGAELPRAEGRPPLAGVVHRASESDVILRITEPAPGDRKSTRLNSSHVKISYAVFCVK